MALQHASKDYVARQGFPWLSGPWSVKQVELSLEDNRVTVEVELKRGIVWVDPEAEGARAHIHGWTERQWRHLSLQGTLHNGLGELLEQAHVRQSGLRVSGSQPAIDQLNQTLLLSLLRSCSLPFQS